MPSLRFLGHSACEIVAGETRLLIDPFLTGNPLAAARPEDLHPTAILVSHAHNDHLGDALAIARRSGALVIACYEIATWLAAQGARTHPLHIGGGHAFPWGEVRLTPALHGCTWAQPDGTLLTLGTAAGLVVTVQGLRIYHAGDTALFSDMALIGRPRLDLALLPIGDNFTMGPEDALEAVRLLKPARAVPIHYNTFPLIRQDAQAWAARVTAETGTPVSVLAPGDSLSL